MCSMLMKITLVPYGIMQILECSAVDELYTVCVRLIQLHLFK